jgi:hypothetical protein
LEASKEQRKNRRKGRVTVKRITSGWLTFKDNGTW